MTAYGVWLGAGTPLDQPWPCWCRDIPEWATSCSPAWCRCAGRPDPQGPDCCANWISPAAHVQAMREWRDRKLAREAQNGL